MFLWGRFEVNKILPWLLIIRLALSGLFLFVAKTFESVFEKAEYIFENSQENQAKTQISIIMINNVFNYLSLETNL